MRKRYIILFAMILIAALLFYILILNPTIQESIGFKISQWMVRLRMAVRPPENVAFSDNQPTPEDDGALPQPHTESEATNQDPATAPTMDELATPAPIPSTFQIARGEYFSQHYRWNYCGPANLAMLLSIWGWEGTHDDIARAVKPYDLDKSVMPYELAEYANQQEGLGALVRVGGDFDTLKRLIAAGFPVMLEKGPHFRDIHYQMTWMGHYQVLNGYNDREGFFIAQDSYIEADYQQPYNPLLEEWRSFNYTYIVAYPQQMENDVLNILGDQANVDENYRHALAKAQEEIHSLRGLEQFFAYFNYGTNLVYLRDYSGAARAYDEAFALYDELPEDITIRPYRILWYQTGPFFAYYYTGRYADVVEKTTKNSIEMVRDDEPALEESYYWRGVSQIALGKKEEGLADLQTCLELHPGFIPCLTALEEQGVRP